MNETKSNSRLVKLFLSSQAFISLEDFYPNRFIKFGRFTTYLGEEMLVKGIWTMNLPCFLSPDAKRRNLRDQNIESIIKWVVMDDAVDFISHFWD